jgi:DNA uptake protein ComE-like DNA-binding protein
MSAIKEYFNYSKHERRGIFVLLTIIMLIIGYNRLIPVFTANPSPDYGAFKQELEQFLAARESMLQSRMVEINTADTAALISLPGIGPYFARRIIKYRDLLGGYCRKEQILEVYGMDSSRYGQFQQFILVDTSKIIRVDINRVEFKALLRHPYFDYETVKEIFNYKREHKGLRSISALRGLDGMPDSVYFRIRPYISVELK